MPVERPIPVAIFVGYLGAGKTTVLQRISPSIRARGEAILTIVNDLSPDNTDVLAFQDGRDAAIASGDAASVRALSGGCVCCNLLGDLVDELLRCHRDRNFTYVLLECTGVAEAAPIVATVSALPALQGKFYVDAVVTVVSAANLLAVTTVGEGGKATLDVDRSDIMGGHQARGANVILLNNWESLIDTTGSDSVASLETLSQWPALLQDFCADSNPHVRVRFTDYGDFDFARTVLRHDLFGDDAVLPFYLRAYGAMDGQIGNFGGGAAEEAFELKKLGLRLLTYRSTALRVSTKQLRLAMTGRHAAGKRLLRDVWRSKGFFDAVDDETCTADGASSRPDTAPREKQFRWQSVGRRFDYGEVLPPRVSLGTVQGTEADTAARAVRCRIVFMGSFDETEKAAEADEFFSAVSSMI